MAYSTPALCTACGAVTVGWSLEALASGVDARELNFWRTDQHRHSTAVRARTAIWWGTGLLLLVLLIAGGRNLVFIPVLLAMAVLAQAGVVRWLRAARPAPTPRPRHPSPQEYEVADKILQPFLERCAGREPEPGAELVEYWAAWDARRHVPVPTAEALMLQRTLAERGIGFAPGVPVPRDGLVGATLLIDRMGFARRMDAACRAGATPVGVYAQCAGSDERWLPFLEEWIQGARSPAEIMQAVVGERERLRQLQFEGDLTARQAGAGARLTLDAVDALTGHAFQDLLALVLEAKGYRIEPMPASRDQGADVLAERAGERLIVQAKHRESVEEGSVGNYAVQEVVAARSHYRATRAAVMTNHPQFSEPAHALARTNGVELWGRDRLADLIEEFNGLPKDYVRLAAILLRVRIPPPGQGPTPAS